MIHDPSFFEWAHAEKITPLVDVPSWPWHSGADNFSGWVAFLVADPTNEKGYRQEWAQARDAWTKIKDYVGVADVRMSWNTFFSPCSKVKNILYYYCCFVDLDYRKVQAYADTAPEDMAETVKKFCDDNDLPEPSLMISSGNGLHLAWRFVIPAMARFLKPKWLKKAENNEIENFFGFVDWDRFNEYTAIQRALARVFAPLGADPVAIDCGKYMRVPGTRNTKAEAVDRDGLVRILHEGKRVYWPDLRAALGVPIMSGPKKGEAPAAKQNNQKKGRKKPAPAPFDVVRGGQTRPDQADTKEQTWGTWVNIDGDRQWVLWKDYNALRYWDLYSLMELRKERNGGTVPEGERDNFLTWLLNFWALWNLEEYEDAEFNKVFRYVFRLLADQIDPAYRRADKYALMRLKTVQKKWGQGWVSWRGKAATALYTPKTSTLLERFGITAEELPYLCTFQPVDTKEQARERKKAQRRREGVRSREDYLKSTVKAMAAAEGVSESTWRRRNPDYVGEKTLKQHPELRAKAK